MMQALCHAPFVMAASITGLEESVTQKGLDASSKVRMGQGAQEEGQDYTSKLIGSKKLNHYHQIMCRATSSQDEDNGLSNHGYYLFSLNT